MSTEYEIAMEKAEWLERNQDGLSFTEREIMKECENICNAAVVLFYEKAFDKIMELRRKNGRKRGNGDEKD